MGPMLSILIITKLRAISRHGTIYLLHEEEAFLVHGSSNFSVKGNFSENLFISCWMRLLLRLQHFNAINSIVDCIGTFSPQQISVKSTPLFLEVSVTRHAWCAQYVGSRWPLKAIYRYLLRSIIQWKKWLDPI